MVCELLSDCRGVVLSCVAASAWTVECVTRAVVLGPCTIPVALLQADSGTRGDLALIVRTSPVRDGSHETSGLLHCQRVQ